MVGSGERRARAPTPPRPPQAATILDAVEAVAASTGLENYKTFTLYADHGPPAAAGGGAGVGASPATTPRSVDAPDPHVPLDDSRYVADVLAELREAAGKAAKGARAPRLLFRKRMFRESDEDVTEPRFVLLSYVQAAGEYMAGAYPVVRDDAAELAALAAAAGGGEGLAPLVGDDDGAADAALASLIPRAVAATRKTADWRADVRARARARAARGGAPADARLEFLRLLRALPYGGSLFYPVKRVEDPIGLLPGKLLLGVNRRGVHFFRPVRVFFARVGKVSRVWGGGPTPVSSLRRRPSSTCTRPSCEVGRGEAGKAAAAHTRDARPQPLSLFSFPPPDIMQFGSSAAAVFFKMRVAGVLHVFQFETKQVGGGAEREGVTGWGVLRSRARRHSPCPPPLSGRGYLPGAADPHQRCHDEAVRARQGGGDDGGRGGWRWGRRRKCR